MSKQYEIIELDVWGNTKDGFVVNDAFNTHRIIEITKSDTDKNILHKVKKHYPNIFKTSPHIANSYGDEYHIFINKKSNNRPLLQLQLLEG